MKVTTFNYFNICESSVVKLAEIEFKKRGEIA